MKFDNARVMFILVESTNTMNSEVQKLLTSGQWLRNHEEVNPRLTPQAWYLGLYISPRIATIHCCPVFVDVFSKIWIKKLNIEIYVSVERPQFILEQMYLFLFGIKYLQQLYYCWITILYTFFVPSAEMTMDP